MKVYEEQLNKVKSATEKLRTRLLEAESRLPAFRKLTGDVIERIKAIGAEHFLHFLKLWFRTFLGMRDECMILITGEIVRNYHIEPHRDYIHERNRESHYYNKDCSLSLCSSDGIDFEYRQLQSKYGSKSAFDKIADAADEIGGRLHALYQSINACHDRLADFIKSLKICKYDADFERFCAESIDIIYIAGEEKKKVTLSSHTYRTCKRAQALSTVVEDPPNVNIAPAATSRVSNDQVTKKPRIRIDLEDSDEEMDVAPSQPVKTDPTLALDFQFTASIEEIKNAYNPPPEQTEPLFGSGNGTAGNAAQQTQQPIFLPYSHISTFCLDSPEMVLARVKVVDPLFVTTANQQDTVGKDHVNLTLPVHHVYNMLDSKTRSKVAQQMLATDLLDEITKLLWLSPLQCVDNHAADSVKLDQCSVDNMCRIWLPKFIQVERVKYSRGTV
ncbi:hypothetical protein EON65_12665 [archaeon]|nr:MAG: hypothetical protein EON65_12665 [archaeon]